jgi:hypothetical protein
VAVCFRGAAAGAGISVLGAGIPTAGYRVGIANIVFAAFNRGILLSHPAQPYCVESKFYRNDVEQNLLCKTIHDNFVESRVHDQ